jgi:hypothetical protein
MEEAMADNVNATFDSERLSGIFFLDARARKKTVIDEGLKFVHYTSAQTAMFILSQQYMWLRNARTMNDFSEVLHGLECLTDAYQTDASRDLKLALDAISPDILKRFDPLFESWKGDFRLGMYFACVSEHPTTEDLYGRLSMWRAYGGNNGVALVFNADPFWDRTGRLNAFAAPVSYGGATKVATLMRQVGAGLLADADFLRTCPPQKIADNLFQFFRLLALGTKHEAFSEEREWRVTYQPSLHPVSLLAKDLQSVDGVPQTIYKIPLQEPPEGLEGLSIAKFIHKVIIGPTDSPAPIYGAFIELLKRAGVEDPTARIAISAIPLRRS